MIPRGFLCSIPIGLLLLITTAAGEEVLVEPTHVTIESKEGQRLRVVFATEDRPALTLKPKGALGTGLGKAGSSSRSKIPAAKR
jgi:hypothetical protein